MLQRLASHNDDIRRLLEKGYALGFDSNYLIVRDIPYLDAVRQLQIGTIVTKLVFVDQDRVQQDDHQIFFAGSVPHNIDGSPIPNLGGGPSSLALSNSADVVVQRSFSNKPRSTGRFNDFFEKVESYVGIIAGPAIELHKFSPLTFRVVETAPTDSVFKFRDTLTSRAEITDLSARFKDDVVAVIGLGGTGAYLLDYLVKTPVKEIRAFDFDQFHVHTAFRSPGKVDVSELGQRKAQVYASRCENFRTGIRIEPKFIDAECGEDLDGVTFAFVCVDKGTSRSGIFDLLLSKRIPFIDVGMGLERKRGALNGTLRMVYYSAEDGEAVKGKHLAPLTDGPEDMYRTSVQISELNALNAALAIMKFKQLRGFYVEEEPTYHVLFGVGDFQSARESSPHAL